MKRVLKIALIVVLIGVFAWTLVFLYQKSREKPVVFETVSPTIDNVVKKTVATGAVVPRREVEIKPQVSGIIEEVFVEAGTMIKAGDLVARVRIIPDMLQLTTAESRVRRAELSLENARKEHERRRDLFNKQVIPETEYNEYKLAWETAREELEAAEDNLQLIRDGVSRRAGKATNTLIRSTVDGMVLDVPVEVGHSVIEANTFNAGTTIATVADMGEMIFEGKIDETEVGKIKEGMELLLTVGAIEDKEFRAVLEFIAPKGVEENGAIQFEIRAAVTLSDSILIRAGYSANAAIVLERRDSVMVIPEGLIQFENDTPYVEVEIAPQTFERRDIRLGLSDGINVEILSGLSKDDRVKALD
ncbi:MAG TPA: efflux RND transporter periplasmic adaptor subunit [Bacteroidales bacterium]|nr:efflux RND transporter periplasmic adaptor subunit [Bacteroidales bacterium]